MIHNTTQHTFQLYHTALSMISTSFTQYNYPGHTPRFKYQTVIHQKSLLKSLHGLFTIQLLYYIVKNFKKLKKNDTQPV